MKKFLVGLIAAFMLSAGFVAVSAETASAACGDKYNPCVATKTSATAPTASAKKKPKVMVTVRAQGNVKPAGTVTITIQPGGKKVTGTVKNGKVTVTLPKLKAGKYSLSITYNPKGDFKASKSTTKLTVKK